MKSQLMIPGKLKVGFQKRSDTYSKKLGYVVYYDEKGKLRKETSFEGWRDKKISAEEYDNVPTEGFVLNKNVGGVSGGYKDWYDHDRIEKVRVFDPRGFEFEITIPNMLYIIQECTSTKGKGLEGEFVYAWDGANLILLPSNSQEYKESQTFTAIQSMGIKKDDMTPGCTYTTKKQKSLIYLGKMGYYELKYERKSRGEVVNTTSQHIFYNPEYVDPKIAQAKSQKDSKEFQTALKVAQKQKDFEYQDFYEDYCESHPGYNEYDEYDDYEHTSKQFIPMASLKNIAFKNSDIVVSNYADLMTEYSNSKFSRKPIGFETANKVPVFEYKTRSDYDHTLPGIYYKEEKPNQFVKLRIDEEQDYDYKTSKYKKTGKYTLNKDHLFTIEKDTLSITYAGEYSDKKYTKEQLESYGFVDLYLKFENGKKMSATKFYEDRYN